METEAIVSCDNLVKIYKVANLEVVALQGLDLEVAKGEMMALIGSSGSGKSTLLNVIGGLDIPSAGKVFVLAQDLLAMSERERVRYKREMVGFVWQQPSRNLLPYLTALENIETPMMLHKTRRDGYKSRARELLAILGLTERHNFMPTQLSGGEQQRLALGVALANNPPLLLVDEVTGQIDSAASEKIFKALRKINETFNTTIIMVTHDPQVAAKVDRIVSIRDGRTSTEIRRLRNWKDGSMEEEEWVILDQAGRLQLPQVYVDTLAMRERVKVRLEDNHVSVWPELTQSDQISLKQWRPTQDFENDQNGAGKAQHTPKIETRDLYRTFNVGVEEITAVRNVSLEIPGGVFALIKGRSGSGKTTLLNLICGLDNPTSGSVYFDDLNISAMLPEEKLEMRRKNMSFVFQNFGLLPFLSARENVEAPLRLVNTPSNERRLRADEVLAQVGLSTRANHRTYELSGGEQQRVALARALVNRPVLILADEPTGQLDSVTGSNIILLLREIVNQLGITVIVASHDPKVAEAVDMVFELKDGELAEFTSKEIPGSQ
ncbi:MAG: ABC transporter ATP-binding protein [Anaerolineales bacterium]|nr:MAG: ABC transporter ATP-binding protein [Anaerolineales bacterium]